MKKKQKNRIILLDFLAVVAFIATFTPLITPWQISRPFLLGFPYTMWAGFLLSIFFVVLTYLASLTNKEENNAD